MILYHRSPQRNRLAITRWGLIPRDTRDYHYPDMDGQPVGVYAIPAGADGLPRESWTSGTWGYQQGIDCWEIDATGLAMVADPLLGWCDGKVIIERVSPDRLTRKPEFGRRRRR